MLGPVHALKLGSLSRRSALALLGIALLFIVSGCSLLERWSIDQGAAPQVATFAATQAQTIEPLNLIPLITTPTPVPSATPTPTTTRARATPIVIGTSVTGRPLEVYSFGQGETHRMIIAGIHGGYEGNTIRLADQLIQVLGARSELIPAGHTLYILRALNPDGEARSSSYKGRVNDNLVDLNRNWPSHWQKTWPLVGCWTYTYVTGGSHAASEPETRALINFLLTYQIDALINYHSAALGIFPGGQPPDPRSVSLAETVAAVSDYPYPPIETGCQYTGQLIDWASDQGIAAIDIELTNHNDSDLAQNLRVLQSFLAWATPTSAPSD
jgi:predicted deacylase